MTEGQQIGSYKILTLLGAGGMGQVYRARDMKLGREVAIKILPPSFASDESRIRRFEREARLLAALNHPRIAGIYGLEQFDGTQGLVLELVEGPTLAYRLASGPMPVKEALGVALQIAEALEAAHEKGILHRDLKPANIKFSSDGAVKVLDFGLAKAVGTESSHLSGALTHDTTVDGQLVGTPAYMSPEQVRAKEIDKRADIWAFGCVLAEMLTGTKVFGKETISDTIAAVLEREPRWDALPSATPENVRRLLRRCLEKDSRRRLRDIGDARIEIEDALATDWGSPKPQGQEAYHPGNLWKAFAVVTIIALIAITVLIVRLTTREGPRPASLPGPGSIEQPTR